jgi:hypothetical protein
MQLFIQSDISLESGNCFQTCLASLLGFETPEFVPNFWAREETEEEIWEFIQIFCSRLKCKIYYTSRDIPKGWSIASGINRFGVFHSCLAFNGKVAHDPLPNGDGLQQIRGYYYLTS